VRTVIFTLVAYCLVNEVLDHGFELEVMNAILPLSEFKLVLLTAFEFEALESFVQLLHDVAVLEAA
jgi:hypothetical protein